MGHPPSANSLLERALGEMPGEVWFLCGDADQQVTDGINSSDCSARQAIG